MDQPTDSAEQTPDQVYLTAVLFESLLAVAALLLGWMLGPDPRALIPELDWEQTWPLISGLLYGLLAAIPILVLIEGVRRLPWEPVRELERLTDDSLIKLLLRLRPGELIVISVCAGIGEELLFRGWMLPWLVGGPVLEAGRFELVVGVIASSIAFGLMHPITKLYVVIAAVMGLYFAVLMIWSGNLLVPIVAHATYDAVQLIMTARQSDREREQSDES